MLVNFIKRNWYTSEDFMRQELNMYLTCRVDVIGGDDEHIAKSHFRHMGFNVIPPHAPSRVEIQGAVA